MIVVREIFRLKSGKAIVASMRILLFCVFMVSPSAVSAQAKAVVLKPVKDAIYYQWITFLTQSASENHPEPSPGATLRTLRVVLATIEGDERIYLEIVTMGPGECCNRIDKTYLIDFYDLAQKFSLDRPMTGITFFRWLSPRSFSFKKEEREFIARLSERDSLSVELP
ncbi:MAG: hypothetical protein HYW57_05050 [Ignavibacteriales bacterium]|nr:hypothetical protein [Ignavibacteriales bacterium]